MPRALPPLNGLRAFEAAARHQSFTRAAEELHVTQTAISHQIRKLEEELGVRLFVRVPGAVHLTHEAEAYLAAVSGAFDGLRDATARLRDAHEPDGPRTLRLSTTPSFATKWLVPRLAAFQAAHPDIGVEVSTGMELVDFRRGEVDVAIRYGRGHWAGLHATWLLAEDILPVCAPRLVGGVPPLRGPADLVRHRLIGVSQYADEWHMWLTAAGLPTALASRVTMFDMPILAIQAAIDGMGVAITHSPLVENDLAAGRLVAPFAMSLPSELGYYLVAPDASAQTPAIAALRDWLLAPGGTQG
jgi:LysR family glycine cleavage system transcriptional activator